MIRKLLAEGNGYDEFSVHFFDRDGDWIEPERHANLTATAFEHPMLIPPPPPRSADDISIYSVLAPGEQFENCHRYDLPPGHALFQAQTSYWPTVSEDLVPERLKGGNVIVSRAAVGILLSQPCVIDVRRRLTDCVVRD